MDGWIIDGCLNGQKAPSNKLYFQVDKKEEIESRGLVTNQHCLLPLHKSLLPVLLLLPAGRQRGERASCLLSGSFQIAFAKTPPSGSSTGLNTREEQERSQILNEG